MIVLVVLLLSSALLIAYEAWALLTGKRLVTMIIRDAITAYPPIGFLMGLGMGLLGAHFAWCP